LFGSTGAAFVDGERYGDRGGDVAGFPVAAGVRRCLKRDAPDAFPTKVAPSHAKLLGPLGEELEWLRSLDASGHALRALEHAGHARRCNEERHFVAMVGDGLAYPFRS
jgi:hypothetical protein